MNIHIVIGVSSGIGNALVQELLNLGNVVIGLGRNNTIEHPKYSFLALDLNDEMQVEQFDFPKIEEDFSLIYNAGVLGEINSFVNQSISNTKNVFQVNYLSATILTRNILRYPNCKQIIYISSGAAKRAIPSWSQYCASKAALDMFAETLQMELQHADRACKIFSVAPGVVDTPMQAEIRSASQSQFPQVQHFQDLFKNYELASPLEIAQKLIYLMMHIQKFPHVCVSLREVIVDD